jgi:hypothetical protein
VSPVGLDPFDQLVDSLRLIALRFEFGSKPELTALSLWNHQ